jgi:hypothetical protein
MVTRRTSNIIFFTVAGILLIAGGSLVFQDPGDPASWVVFAAAAYLIVHQAGIAPRGAENEKKTTI